MLRPGRKSGRFFPRRRADKRHAINIYVYTASPIIIQNVIYYNAGPPYPFIAMIAASIARCVRPFVSPLLVPSVWPLINYHWFSSS